MTRELEKPFTKDQVCWLEDQLTSLMTQFALAERLSGKLKTKCLEILKAVKENAEVEQGNGEDSL